MDTRTALVKLITCWKGSNGKHYEEVRHALVEYPKKYVDMAYKMKSTNGYKMIENIVTCKAVKNFNRTHKKMPYPEKVLSAEVLDLFCYNLTF